MLCCTAWLAVFPVPGFLVLFPGLSFLSCKRNIQLLATHANFFQIIKDRPWHTIRQINQTVVIKYADAPDVLAIEAGFIGNGTNDVARLDLVIIAHLQSITPHALFG